MSKNKYKNSNSNNIKNNSENSENSNNSISNTISSIGSVMPFSKEFLFALFVFAIVLLIQPSKASAATIDVATGSASINDGDSICQLEEAIENINDGSRVYADCVESGAYGNDDTINLPGGSVGSQENISELDISATMTILGHGKGISTLEATSLSIFGAYG